MNFILFFKSHKNYSHLTLYGFFNKIEIIVINIMVYFNALFELALRGIW